MQRLWREMTKDREGRLRTAHERRLAGRITATAWVSGSVALLVVLALPATASSGRGP